MTDFREPIRQRLVAERHLAVQAAERALAAARRGAPGPGVYQAEHDLTRAEQRLRAAERMIT